MKGKADLVIKGESIFTGNTSTPIQGKIVISNDRIVAVEKYFHQISSWVGKQTRIIDAGDQLVLAGFHDFHVHLWIGAMQLMYADLTDCYSEEDTVDRMTIFAQNHPDLPWILGFGWHQIKWMPQTIPTRHSLDRKISDRPVFLLNEELHSAWLNTKGLEVAGIDQDTQDPLFGKIERDEEGNPTGFLYETAISLALSAFELKPEERKKLMPIFLQKAASFGITSISDMLPLPGFEMGDPAWYARYEKSGDLTIRIHFLSAMNGDLSKADAWRSTYQSDKLSFSGLKQFIDGVPLTYTGFLSEPYTDNPTKRGGTLFPYEVYEKWIIEADRHQFRIRLHACGDAAVRLALDCFEKARKINGPRDARHCIEHIEIIHPEDLHRFQELGIIASMQPEHMTAGSVDNHAYIDRLGIDRCRLTWPIGSLQQHGAPLIFSSDFPVVGLNPLVGIYRAVTRKHDDETPADGWHPEQKISLAEALTYYTKNPAYGNFQESDLGTIEPGKKADVIILDRNLFAIDEKDWLETKVDVTIMDGKIIYER